MDAKLTIGSDRARALEAFAAVIDQGSISDVGRGLELSPSVVVRSTGSRPSLASRLVSLLEPYNLADVEQIHAGFVGSAYTPAQIRVFVDFLVSRLPDEVGALEFVRGGNVCF